MPMASSVNRSKGSGFCVSVNWENNLPCLIQTNSVLVFNLGWTYWGVHTPWQGLEECRGGCYFSRTSKKILDTM